MQIMKRIIIFILAISMCVGLFTGCGGASVAESSSTDTQSTNVTQVAEPETQPEEQQYTPAWNSGPEALQGKKILFIGNSYTFWGQTVILKGTGVLDQKARSNDQGYFYQLCKAKGIDVSVTNWTFGGHNITDMFDGPCAKGDDRCAGEYHEYYLQDRYFDYVCIQPYKEAEYTGDLVAYLKYTMDLFRQVNPNVCFLLLVPQMAAEKQYKWLKDVDVLKDENVRICNWGGMLHDISQGTTQVPGATLPYSRASFVNTLDDHHENLLAGYLTTLFTYCAITGESAVGQPYDFCDNAELNKLFDLEAFRAENYPGGINSTNFVEIFRSEADMTGLQQLVDEYLAK